MQKTIYTPAYRELIHRLRDRRVALGLSQRAVARSLHMQRSFITKVEMSESRLDVCQLVRFCRLYGLCAPKLVRQLEGEMSEGEDLPRVLRRVVAMATLCSPAGTVPGSELPGVPSTCRRLNCPHSQEGYST